MEKTNKPKYGMAHMSAYMIGRAYREVRVILPIAAGIILCGIAVNLLELFVVPAILRAVENNASIQELVSLIAAFTGAMILAYAARTYLNFNALFGRVHLRVNMSVDIHQAFCRTSYCNILDTAYIEQSEKALAPTRSNQDASEAIWATLCEFIIHITSFAAYLLLLSNAGALMIIITLLTAAASYFFGRRIRQWRYRHRKEESAHRNKLRYIIQSARDRELAKDIRIFGLGDWLEELFDGCYQLFQSFLAKSSKINLLADALDILATLMRNGVAYFYLIHLALNGGLSAAEFVLYFSAATGLGSWMEGILNDLYILNRQSAELSITREFLEAPEPFQFEDGEPLQVRPEHLYALELRDVSYRYPNAQKDTLSHINLKIQPGEKLAIVGLNGAGKTTMIRLLCGFLDPTEGSVLLDGVDIRRYNRRDYYKLISAVFQQSSILAGSIAENVAQRSDEIDMQRMQQCLEWAGLAQMVAALPQGADTHLNRSVYADAVELSGGQMQRLLLARALYKAAPIIVLDEPTAALDPISESKIYQKYNEMTSGYTSIYISHRLASTRFCDRIILVNGGAIQEEGTHDELIARGGEYAKLFGVQSKYYRDEAEQNGKE